MCATLSSLTAKVAEQLYLSSTTRLSTNIYTDKDSTSLQRIHRNLKRTPFATTIQTNNPRRALISQVYQSDFDDTEDESYLISLKTIEESPYIFGQSAMFRVNPQNQLIRTANDSDYGSDDETLFKERSLTPTIYRQQAERRFLFHTPANEIDEDEYNTRMLTPTKDKKGTTFQPPKPYIDHSTLPYDHTPTKLSPGRQSQTTTNDGRSSPSSNHRQDGNLGQHKTVDHQISFKNGLSSSSLYPGTHEHSLHDQHDTIPPKGTPGSLTDNDIHCNPYPLQWRPRPDLNPKQPYDRTHQDTSHYANTSAGHVHITTGDINFIRESSDPPFDDNGSHEQKVELVFKAKLTGEQYLQLVGQQYAKFLPYDSDRDVPGNRPPFDPQSSSYKTRPGSQSHKPDDDSDRDVPGNRPPFDPQSSSYKTRPGSQSHKPDDDSDRDVPRTRPAFDPQSSSYKTRPGSQSQINPRETHRSGQDDREKPYTSNMFSDPRAGSIFIAEHSESKDDEIDAYNFGCGSAIEIEDDEVECTVLGRSSQGRSRKDQFNGARYSQPAADRGIFERETVRETETEHYARPNSSLDPHYTVPSSTAAPDHPVLKTRPLNPQSATTERESTQIHSHNGPKQTQGEYSTRNGRSDPFPGSGTYDVTHDQSSLQHEYDYRPFQQEREHEKHTPTVLTTYDEYEADPDVHDDSHSAVVPHHVQPAGISALVKQNPIHSGSIAETQSLDSQMTSSVYSSSKMTKAEKDAAKQKKKVDEKVEKQRKKDKKKQELESAKKSGSKSKK